MPKQMEQKNSGSLSTWLRLSPVTKGLEDGKTRSLKLSGMYKHEATQAFYGKLKYLCVCPSQDPAAGKVPPYPLVWLDSLFLFLLLVHPYQGRPHCIPDRAPRQGLAGDRVGGRVPEKCPAAHRSDGRVPCCLLIDYDPQDRVLAQTLAWHWKLAVAAVGCRVCQSGKVLPPGQKILPG